MKIILVVTAAIAIVLQAGCAATYKAPTSAPKIETTKVVAGSKDEVWAKAVAGISQNFFVINNMDKSSGFMNVSYSGEPIGYVDCGSISAFGITKEVIRTNGIDQEGPFTIHYNSKMEGRINLLIQEVSSNSTRVTANAKYLVERRIKVPAVSSDETVGNTSFNSGGTGQISTGTQFATCHSTGKLEREILGVFN